MPDLFIIAILHLHFILTLFSIHFKANSFCFAQKCILKNGCPKNLTSAVKASWLFELSCPGITAPRTINHVELLYNCSGFNEIPCAAMSTTPLY